MAALWRRAVYFSLIRSSVRSLFRKPSVRSSNRWRRIYSGVALAVGGGLCAVPFKQVDHLSHESLVRRAASLVTDSSNTFLSQTTLALIDALTEYSKAVHTLISLHKHYLASLGKLTPAQEDSIWQVIISQRGEVNDRHDACQRFESTWVTAMKLCEMAAEAAYVSGAEQASVTAKTNIQVAQSQVEVAQKLSLDADKKLAAAKVMEIERMTQHTASLQNSSDDEETPEAYLRED
uniref:Direct IAP-binding protein with low pI n=1 Tax=Iconisemion striatum TaxID=60296 RepID=A0A1A7Y7G4_9TELE